ncbi:MAG TPA: extracellular solute-binding protein [Aeromicrobium sp.]|nr:extracellular solute-binding protein [Aeromicrobium sp.]HKY57782.1 extracellular solute-binding protein [Aeromicrobium sp.]
MRTRYFILLVLALTLSASLAGCGSSQTKTLTWWTLPDRVGEEALAEQCSDAAGGYRIDVHVLPPLLKDRRADLVRRLSAGGDDIDILTLDSALTAEFAAAKFLAPLPEALTFDIGIIPAAAEAATYRGKLVAVPWWVDPQLLWFRGASAERAGIDTNRPVSWDALLAGADRIRASVQVDNADGTGVSDWVVGLVAEAGGQVMTGTGRKPKVGLNSDAGRVAAGLVQFYVSSGLGAGPSDRALSEFAGTRGAFLVARASARTAREVVAIAADMRPLRYPVIGGVSKSPMAAAALAVPRSSENRKAAFAAIKCLSSAESQAEIMVNSGRGAARASVYQNGNVRRVVPYAPTLLSAARDGVNVPSTPYWHLAEKAITSAWTPLSAVAPNHTPKESAAAVATLVGGGLR